MRRFVGRRALALAGAPLALALLSLTLWVGAPRAAATGAPTVTISGYPGPGDNIVVGGGNWPYGDPLTITYDGAPLATAKANLLLAIAGPAIGAFSVSAQVPLTTTLGAHTIVATDTQTNATAQTTITVSAEWKQFGFTSANTRYNPYETAISAANVSTLTQAWTFNTGYTSYVKPTVSGGDLIISNGAAHYMYALDPTTGAQLWSQYPDASYEQVAVDDGIIYSNYQAMEVRSLATGALLWQSPLIGASGDPVLANGLVYVDGVENNNPVIQAYPASGCGQATCDPLWTYTSPGGYVGTPAVANGSLYLGGSELSVVDATTGAPQWTAAITSGETIDTVVVDNGYVFFVGRSTYNGGTLYVFDAAGCGQATCTPLWTAHNAAGWGHSPAAANGVIYLGGWDNALYAFEEVGCGATTCAPLWKGADSSITSAIVSPPAVANGVVYVIAYQGMALAFDATGCKTSPCSPLWSYTMQTPWTWVDTPPTVANGMLYVSDVGGYLYAFHLPAATAQRSGASQTSPAAPATPQRGASQPARSPSRSPRAQAIWAARLSRSQGGWAAGQAL